MKYKIGILKNENDKDHIPWIDACEKYKDLVDYKVINLLNGDWLSAVSQYDADCYLTRPSGIISSYKTFYDERLTIIANRLHKKIFPDLTSNLIYENKRLLAYWLQLNDMQHPLTLISMSYNDALKSAEALSYPIVAKSSIGAGGSGVRFLNNGAELVAYCKSVFFGNGASRKWGPNLRKGSLVERSLYRLSHPISSIKYFKEKKSQVTSDPQKNHVIFQEYIESEYEWRIVRVGDSFFGHKKLKGNSKMFSGTSHVSWDYPDTRILDFAKRITDESGFRSMALDLFVGNDELIYINELQCFWGSKNPHQMVVDGIPGRFVDKDGDWIFEAGSFNQNNSYDLRLEWVLHELSDNNDQ